MDLSRKTVELCQRGIRAEFEKRLEDANLLYQEAWEAAEDDLDRAIAAHYRGHLASDPLEAFRWHSMALELGRGDPRADGFLGSFFVCLGGALKALGREKEAEEMFVEASSHGIEHYRGPEATGHQVQ